MLNKRPNHLFSLCAVIIRCFLKFILTRPGKFLFRISLKIMNTTVAAQHYCPWNVLSITHYLPTPWKNDYTGTTSPNSIDLNIMFVSINHFCTNVVCFLASDYTFFLFISGFGCVLSASQLRYCLKDPMQLVNNKLNCMFYI